MSFFLIAANHYALKLALPKVREANNRAFIEELFGVLEKVSWRNPHQERARVHSRKQSRASAYNPICFTFFCSVVSYLMSLQQKKDIGDNEAISDDLVGYAHIENFALKIFKRADDEDRAGQASQ